MSELETLRRENAELRRLAELQAAQMARLIEQLARLNERVSELLAVAQRKTRKTPAEKPPVAPPAVEGEARRTFEERPSSRRQPSRVEGAHEGPGVRIGA